MSFGDFREGACKLSALLLIRDEIVGQPLFHVPDSLAVVIAEAKNALIRVWGELFAEKREILYMPFGSEFIRKHNSIISPAYEQVRYLTPQCFQGCQGMSERGNTGL